MKFDYYSHALVLGSAESVDEIVTVTVTIRPRIKRILLNNTFVGLVSLDQSWNI